MKKRSAWAVAVTLVLALCACGEKTPSSEWQMSMPVFTSLQTLPTTVNPKNSEAEVPISDPSDGEGAPERTAEVLEAWHYEKEVMITDPENPPEENWERHIVSYPRVLGGEGADALSAKIAEHYGILMRILEGNQEGVSVVKMQFFYGKDSGMVALAVEEAWKCRNSPAEMFYDLYYYAIESDREVTFEDYLGAVGVTRARLAEVLAEILPGIYGTEEEITVSEEKIKGLLLEDDMARIFYINPLWGGMEESTVLREMLDGNAKK